MFSYKKKKSVLKGLRDVQHDVGILIYLKSILLSLSHRFDSFAPANMLHVPCLVFYVCCMHADSVRKTKYFISKCFFLIIYIFIFFYLSQIR